VEAAAGRRYDRCVSGEIERVPEVEPQLTLPPSAAERLAALEAERGRELAAIQELEGKLREAAACRELMNERGRFRGMIPLGFFLGLAMVTVFVVLLSGVGGP
jgi:hypothetical protein